MRMISGSLQRSKTFDFHSKAKNLYDSTMKAWVDEFRSSSNFLGLSLREAVDRAMTFLKADLKPFAPDPALFTSVVANRISLIFRNFIEKDSATVGINVDVSVVCRRFVCKTRRSEISENRNS